MHLWVTSAMTPSTVYRQASCHQVVKRRDLRIADLSLERVVDTTTPPTSVKHIVNSNCE